MEYEITELGTVENIVILQDPGDGIGEESKRVLMLITEGEAYSPGILERRPHRVKRRLPIKFRVL